MNALLGPHRLAGLGPVLLGSQQQSPQASVSNAVNKCCLLTTIFRFAQQCNNGNTFFVRPSYTHSVRANGLSSFSHLPTTPAPTLSSRSSNYISKYPQPSNYLSSLLQPRFPQSPMPPPPLLNPQPRVLTHPRYRFRYYSTNTDSDANQNSRKSRLKQFFLKWKPRTADHIIAMVSWAVFGTTFWVIVGTTTLASVILWIVNTFQFGEYIATKVGDYLTQESGIQIKFESAVGNWKQRHIRLKNVSVVREGSEAHKQSAVHLTIDYVDVKLSLLWLLEGRGILKMCKASGIRGSIDRRFEGTSNPNVRPPRRKARRGDFVLENLTLSDVLVTLYLPDPSHRPLPISIYSFNCDWFRKQWMLLDLFSAKSVVGRFDTCLFTFGIPQRVGPQPANNSNLRELKIDGVPFDAINKSATGPLGWIKEGTLDISAIIAHPPKYIEGISDSPKWNYGSYGLHGTAGSYGSDVTHMDDMDAETNDDTLAFRVDCMFNHLLVVAPLYTPHLSYLSNALIHPILSYMNAHNKHIPLTFDMRIPLAEFDGAWTPSEAGFWDFMSKAVGEAFAQAVAEKKNADTLKTAAGTFLKDVWGWMGALVPARTPTYI